MCFFNKVFVVYCILSFVIGQDSEQDSIDHHGDVNKKVTDPPVDQHTFVALIDIIFTDGSKRTCTGAIIHDNVVITAAHCFVSERGKSVKPELTTSFVVIGTKKMFETGYEQYLPIERVVTHPKYRGWTADLALVFTFAGMISDKPGTVIALAGDKTSAPVDSNVTVLSWGHEKNDFSGQLNKKKKPKKENCPSSESAEHHNHFRDTHTRGESLRAGRHSSSEEYHSAPKITKQMSKRKRAVRTTDRTTRTYRTRFMTVKQSVQKYQIDLDEYKDRSRHGISRYLTSREESNFTKTKNEDHQLNDLNDGNNYTTKKNIITTVADNNVTIDKTKEDSQIEKMKIQYNNWRRRMGPQQNKLIVEVFGFVNMQTCKKVVEKAMPEIYEIKGGTDIVCYASDDHLITAEDSGAPAVRNGQLVAVTVGGAECDGDHVAVGMKMSCYCSWIADNLPPSGTRFRCCRNCCDVTHVKEITHRPLRMKYRNKYLL